MNKIKRALNKITPVARKEGNSYYPELQGLKEITQNVSVVERLRVPFKTSAEAIAYGRKVIEELKLEVIANDVENN